MGVIGAIVVVSCGIYGGDKDKGTEQGGEHTQTTAAAVGTALNTFINASIEIDQLGSTGLGPDANHFTGNDPYDQTASRQFPTGGPANFIDWNDLGSDLANHRLLDLDGPGGKDPTSFPQSNECVGTSQVLSKMDLTYVASANNNVHAYFAVQRSDNNGDAGYYWLFTKKEPKLIAGQAPCSADQKRLVYDISGPADGGGLGDVMLAGHFKPSSSIPLLKVYRATRDQNAVTAVDAINFGSSLWTEVSNAVSAAAVNTTRTAPGAFGSDGVKAAGNGYVDTETFAEAAVPISIFTSGSACGASFFGSVITRSSGAGGTSPDLKDLAGPALFNFGSITASGSLTGSCDGTLAFSASATGTQGTASCTWTFKKDGQPTSLTASTCSGTLTGLAAGSYEGTVIVSDSSGTACQDDATTAPASVFSGLDVNITPSATSLVCSSTDAGAFSDAVTYTAHPSGGTGTYTYSWTGTTCTEGSQTGSTCTINPADNDFCPVVKLKVTLNSGTCASKTSEEETYTKQTTVTATNN